MRFLAGHYEICSILPSHLEKSGIINAQLNSYLSRHIPYLSRPVLYLSRLIPYLSCPIPLSLPIPYLSRHIPYLSRNIPNLCTIPYLSRPILRRNWIPPHDWLYFKNSAVAPPLLVLWPSFASSLNFRVWTWFFLLINR